MIERSARGLIWILNHKRFLGIPQKIEGSLSLRLNETQAWVARIGDPPTVCMANFGVIEPQEGLIFKTYPAFQEFSWHLKILRAIPWANSVFYVRAPRILDFLKAGLWTRLRDEELLAWIGNCPRLPASTPKGVDPLAILRVLSYSNLCLIPDTAVVTVGRTPQEAVWLYGRLEEAFRIMGARKLEETQKGPLKTYGGVGEEFFVSEFPWALFGKDHRSFIEERIALNREAFFGFQELTPFKVVFLVDEVADGTPRRLGVRFAREGVELLKAEETRGRKEILFGKFPVLEALFAGKTPLVTAIRHGRIEIANSSWLSLTPRLKALNLFLTTVKA